MSTDQSLKLQSLLKILKDLNSGHTITPGQLAVSLEVTERTVYRYIVTLQGAGYPIYFDRTRNSYFFSDGYKLSEQKQNTELIQALDLKSRMLGSSSVGLLSYDQSGQCVVANDAAAALVGGTREQLLTQNYTTLDSWKTSGMLLLAKKVMASGTGAEDDFQITTSFNLPVWLHCSMSRFEQSGKSHLMVVFHDISRQKQTEQKLQQLADQYHVLANTTMDAFWILDDAGKILDVNQRACFIYGYTREELLEKQVQDFVEKAQQKKIKECIRLNTKNGYARFEARHRVRNGSIIDVEVSAARIPGTTTLLSFNKDITAQKIAEQQALQERDEKYRRLFETMALGVVFQDPDGKIISANPAAERILGVTMDQMQGKTSLDPGWRTINEDGFTISGSEHPSMVALRTGIPVFEFIMGVFNPVQKSHTWLSITAIPLIHPGKTKPYQVYTTFTDITETHADAREERGEKKRH
jgi:PAS domain S-box-containing protein